MTRNIFLGLVLAGLTGAGCTETNKDTPAPTTEASAADKKLGVAPAETLDEDTLALQAYARMQEAFAANRADSVKLAIYSLQPVGDAAARLQERAGALGLGTRAVQQTEAGVSLAVGTRELSMDALSGTERYVDQALFHQGEGLAAVPLAKSDYIALARAYVQKVLPELASRELRPYRLRQYMNDSAGPGGVRTGATVYQVAVAFHETVGGMPVIGPGGKLAVHMTPAGEVISYESTLRPTAERIAEVSGAGLLAPDAARQQVEERLTAQGVKLADYKLTRAEFGYLRLGRNSVQSALVPHYAYFYEPVSREVVGKKRVEFLPAVTDPAALAPYQKDQEAEAARKARLQAHAAPPDAR